MCLCMIVKDEAHIIHETLKCMLPYIDYWVICDTGSTDGTCEIIQEFFGTHNVPGELFHDVWKDFGHNRTLAFKRAYKKSRYVWVMDADDIITGHLQLPSPLNADGFVLQIGDPQCRYCRPQIFRNNLEWKYVGILHEFATCVSKKNPQYCFVQGKYYINSRRLGGRNTNPLKYLRDAQLLENAIKTDHELSARYTLYTAQSYHDYGDPKKAIYYYRQRLRFPDTNEEWYESYMRIASCYEALDAHKHHDKIVENFVLASRKSPWRAEPLFLHALLCIRTKDYKEAYTLLKKCITLPLPKNIWGVLSTDVYTYDARTVFIQVCTRLEKTQDEENAWKHLLCYSCDNTLWSKIDIRRYPVAITLLTHDKGTDRLTCSDKGPVSVVYNKNDDGIASFLACAMDRTTMVRSYETASSAPLPKHADFVIVIPDGWLFIRPSKSFLHDAIHYFHDETVVKVFFHPENTETGFLQVQPAVATQHADADRTCTKGSRYTVTLLSSLQDRLSCAENGPYIEKVRDATGTKTMYTDDIYCVRYPLATCEVMERQISPRQVIHYAISSEEPVLNQFLCALFLYGVCSQSGISFCFSTRQYYQSQRLVKNKWKDRTSMESDITIEYFHTGDFFPLDWVDDLQHAFSGLCSLLKTHSNTSHHFFSLVLADEFDLDVDEIGSKDFPLISCLHLLFRIPILWKDNPSPLPPMIPYHTLLPESVFTDKRVLPSIVCVDMQAQDANQIIQNMTRIHTLSTFEDLVQTDTSFVLVLKSPYRLSLPVLQWMPLLFSVVLNIRDLREWSCIDINDNENNVKSNEWTVGGSRGDFYIYNTQEEENSRARVLSYPLVAPLHIHGRNNGNDHILLHHIHCIDSEVFYNPDVEVVKRLQNDAYNTAGFLKRWAPGRIQHCEYDPEYIGDYMAPHNFFLDGNVRELGLKTWQTIDMKVPRVGATCIPCYCVSLKKRPDRRRAMRTMFQKGTADVHFVDAVDGYDIIAHHRDHHNEIFNLILGNVFGSRRGVMGCALSHMKLWEALVADDSHSFYVVFEDDITISTDKPFFQDIQASLVVIERMLQALPLWDVLMLGYSRLKNKTPCRPDTLSIEPLLSDYVGGTFGYVIHKKAAAFLLGTIRYTGIYLPIDNLMTYYYFQKRFLNFFQLSCDLVTTEWFRCDDPSYENVDTDIQKDNKTIVFYNQSDFVTIGDATFMKNTEHRPIDMIHLVGIVAHVDKYVACSQDTLFTDVSLADLVPSPTSDVFIMKRKIIGDQQCDLSQKFQVVPHFNARVLCTVRGGDKSFLQHLVFHHPDAIGYTSNGCILADGDDVFIDAMVVMH